MGIGWSRWKVWILVLLFVVGTALVLIPLAEGAGIDQYANGDYAGAIADFEEELTHTTGADQAPVLNNIGTCYVSLGQPEKAADYYSRAVTADPSLWKGMDQPWCRTGATWSSG